MSNFEFLLIIFLLNSFALSLLIYRAINKKSPRVLLKFFFLPPLLGAFISMIIQWNIQFSEISYRQLLGNIIFIAWCIKSFNSYKFLKALLLDEFLSFVRENITKKQFFKLLMGILKISFFQIMCFSSVFALNYLSGYSGLNSLDILGITLCIAGLSLEIISEKEIKLNSGKGFIKSGLWSYVRHPNITGIILVLLGLQTLALGAVGSEWSIIGFIILIWIINKRLIPNIEKRLLSKFPEYISYMDTMPKLITFKKIN